MHLMPLKVQCNSNHHSHFINTTKNRVFLSITKNFSLKQVIWEHFKSSTAWSSQLTTTLLTVFKHVYLQLINKKTDKIRTFRTLWKQEIQLFCVFVFLNFLTCEQRADRLDTSVHTLLCSLFFFTHFPFHFGWLLIFWPFLCSSFLCFFILNIFENVENMPVQPML